MDICLSSSDPCASGGHRTITAQVDGVTFSRRFTDGELLEPLSDHDREMLFLLTARLVRQSSAPSLAEMAGRVLRGEEATNVKQYDLIAAGAAITKTNIGTAYTNILPGANGQRSLVDFRGCTEFRLILNANLIGSGPWAARVVRDSDDAVLFESTNLGAAGERELDSGWLSLPAPASGLELVRVQAKSTTAADDPVFRRCVLVVR